MNSRWTVWAAGTVLAICVIGWIVYVPSSALNLKRPIPAHARIIYSSAKPDRSPADFPMFASRLRAQASDTGKNGIEFSNGSTELTTGVWKKFFQPLEKFPLAAAIAPLGGYDRRDTWIVVSAPGRRAFWMRWKLTLFPPEGIRRVRSYGAWPVWQIDDASLPSWACVRFTLTEGLLICSVSDDSHDIYYLLDTLDGRRPSLADRKENR